MMEYEKIIHAYIIYMLWCLLLAFNGKNQNCKNYKVPGIFSEVYPKEKGTYISLE